jgi:transcriptional regulator with XRE-family HTH domain
MLRTWIRRKGLTTAQVAGRSGLERAHVKALLAGQEIMSIDEFLLVTQALDIGPEELGLAPPPEPTSPEPPTERKGPRLVVATEADAPPAPIPLRPPQVAQTVAEPHEPDALGNLPRQVLQLGFALGIDLFLILDARQLRTSNVPPAVLSRFQDALPIRLEARYHSHNRPRYLDDCFECVLSFDALYTCSFPWSAFREVRFLLPEEAPRAPAPERPEPEPTKPPGGGPRLRVVK